MATAITATANQSYQDGTHVLYTTPAGKRFVGNFEMLAEDADPGVSAVIGEFESVWAVEVKSDKMIVLSAGQSISLRVDMYNTVQSLVSGIEEDDV